MKRPFIIAEVGSNWKNFGHAKDSIQAAKVAGANAVKFQLFTHEELYGVPGKMDGELPAEWLPQLKEKADAAGIEFMCSAFSVAGVEIVNQYVSRHKLASPENNHLDLIDAMIESDKPLIYSCGGSGLADIGKTLSYIEQKHGIGLEITLLYCVSAYPCRSHNLFNIEKLKKFGYKVGLSDHSLDIIHTPVSAAYYHEIEVLEKHFKLEGIEGTPDAGHSLSAGQFKLMVDRLGIDPTDDKTTYRSTEEYDAVTKYNRRAIVTAPIGKGQVLKNGENFGYFRSLKEDVNGLGPGFPLNGKISSKDLALGDSIGPQDFQ
tara:strand:+ start:2083 stop:3036 length:954 start_codon:yes stop_codon:yes gene_type:complete